MLPKHRSAYRAGEWCDLTSVVSVVLVALVVDFELDVCAVVVSQVEICSDSHFATFYHEIIR